jgi:hypothetical protein
MASLTAILINASHHPGVFLDTTRAILTRPEDLLQVRDRAGASKKSDGIRVSPQPSWYMRVSIPILPPSEHLLAIIIAAVLAGVMDELHFVALRAPR